MLFLCTKCSANMIVMFKLFSLRFLGVFLFGACFFFSQSSSVKLMHKKYPETTFHAHRPYFMHVHVPTVSMNKGIYTYTGTHI